MINEVMSGINKDALVYIVSQISRRKVDSAEELLRVGSVLKIYDKMFSDSLADDFVKSNQIVPKRNLTTKPILEAIVERGDITSLMSVDTIYPRGDEEYDWQTDFNDHRIKLHHLRRLGNRMDVEISEIFIEKAQQLYGSLMFERWEKIVEIDPAKIDAKTPLKLAHEIFSYVQKNPSEDNISHGVKALLYIDQQKPNQEQVEVIVNYAAYFINNMSNGNKDLRTDLINAVGYEGPQKAV